MSRTSNVLRLLSAHHSQVIREKSPTSVLLQSKYVSGFSKKNMLFRIEQFACAADEAQRVSLARL
jgi:hypothetical protein